MIMMSFLQKKDLKLSIMAIANKESKAILAKVVLIENRQHSIRLTKIQVTNPVLLLSWAIVCNVKSPKYKSKFIKFMRFLNKNELNSILEKESTWTPKRLVSKLAYVSGIEPFDKLLNGKLFTEVVAQINFIIPSKGIATRNNERNKILFCRNFRVRYSKC